MNMIRYALLFLLLVLHEIDAQNRKICININRCRSLIDRIRGQSLTKELHDYLLSIQCGFDGFDPKVLCEDQTSVTVTPQLADPPNVANHLNLRLLNDDLCGPIREQKIFGGNETGVFDFPWMALLAYTVGKSGTEFKCGGTLINKRYVLTAAHCVHNIALKGVRLGDHDLSTERDCDKEADEFEVICAEKYQDFGVESIHIHPKFSTTVRQNDIALIRLDRDADLRPQNVRPICMPIGSAATLTKRNVVVTGWGLTERNETNVLMRVHLPLIDVDKCAQIYANDGVKIWYKQICAGGENGKDSCSGDSGGPLQAPENGKFIQYGIVSFGGNKCGERRPGVYTKIVYYMDWILDTIKK